MIGIYKIINPKGKIYIGQSINIERRFRFYKNINCKAQNKLYNSLKYYGFEAHKFEIIIECFEFQLNDLERYYQDLYNVCSNSGLNCILTYSKNRSGKMCKDSREKISKSNKGKIVSEETKKKNSEAQKKLYLNGYINPMTGRSHSQETKNKISKANLGREVSDTTKIKMSKNSSSNKQGYINSMFAKNHSNEAKIKISLAMKGHNNPMAKKVINKETNLIYDCAKYCWEDNKEYLKIKYASFNDKLRGYRKNNTKFEYV